nr:hypothetical protein GCM10020063_102190 [Dactylosporangium thailandense]
MRGDQDVVKAKVSGGGGPCESNSMTVSPDGKRVAWIGDADELKGTGSLFVEATDGSGKKTVDTGVLCFGAAALVWKGGDLLAASKDGRQIAYDLAKGAATPIADPEQLQAASADGSWKASKFNDQRLVTNGQQSHVYSYQPPAADAERYSGWAARGVSADGRYVAVGWLGTDPSRKWDTFAVVDTATSKAVALPVSGTVLFAANGQALVRGDGRVVVLDAQLRQVASIAEGDAMKDMRLLAYVG